MADEQAYKLTNFKNILSYYSTLIENAMFAESDGLHAENPFMPESWTYYDTDPITNNSIKRVVYNPGYTYAQEIKNAFKDTANRIHNALMTLFINYDDDEIMWQEDFNFNMINAYASASQSLQWYNKDTEEFENMPEYWFTRGCWYDMLPMCTKGDYIRSKYSRVLSAIDVIKKYRRYYEYDFVFTDTYSEDDGEGYSTTYSTSYKGIHNYLNNVQTGKYRYRYITYSPYRNKRFFVLAFWRECLTNLSNEIKTCLDPIWDFGKPTSRPEQTESTAKLTYVTQLASETGRTFQRSNTAVATAKKLSDTSETYNAKAAKISILK